jgi:hypothetical protein
MSNTEQDMFLFLCLQRAQKLEEYTKWFPHYASQLQHCRILWNRFVRKVHDKYLLQYVKKKVSPTTQAQQKIDWHVQTIHHTIYIPSLCTTIKKVVNKDIVKNYLLSISPLELMHLLYN